MHLGGLFVRALRRIVPISILVLAALPAASAFPEEPVDTPFTTIVCNPEAPAPVWNWYYAWADKVFTGNPDNPIVLKDATDDIFAVNRCIYHA